MSDPKRLTRVEQPDRPTRRPRRRTNDPAPQLRRPVSIMETVPSRRLAERRRPARPDPNPDATPIVQTRECIGRPQPNNSARATDGVSQSSLARLGKARRVTSAGAHSAGMARRADHHSRYARARMRLLRTGPDLDTDVRNPDGIHFRHSIRVQWIVAQSIIPSNIIGRLTDFARPLPIQLIVYLSFRTVSIEK
jgi:hypothetical protein